MLNPKDISRLDLKQLRLIKPHFDKAGAKNQVTLDLISKEIQKKSKTNYHGTSQRKKNRH